MQSVWTVAAQRAVDIFEAADEIIYLGARVWSTGRFAEMCPAPERAAVVNDATQRARIEHRTDPVVLAQFRPAARAERLGQEQRFAAREKWRLARQLELATFTATFAMAFHRAFAQLVIDRHNLCAQGCVHRLLWTCVCHGSDHFAGRVPGCPGPLKIVSAEPSGDIDHFADKKETRDFS